MKNNYLILSGIDGGKGEKLVNFLSGKVTNAKGFVNNKYQIYTFKFPHNYTFINTFEILDRDFFYKIDKDHTLDFTLNIVAHSFSVLIIIYFLQEKLSEILKHNVEIKLITIDYSNSLEAIEYIDSLSEEDRKDKNLNPFSDEVIEYMRQHDSVNCLANIAKEIGKKINIININAEDINCTHEFENEEDKEKLWSKILSA